jgi:hypothetical protein
MILFFSLFFFFFLFRKVAPGGAGLPVAVGRKKKKGRFQSPPTLVCGLRAAKSPWYVRDESAVVCEGAHFLKTPYKSGVQK